MFVYRFCAVIQEKVLFSIRKKYSNVFSTPVFISLFVKTGIYSSGMPMGNANHELYHRCWQATARRGQPHYVILEDRLALASTK